MNAPYPLRYFTVLGVDVMVHRISEFSVGAMFLVDVECSHWHIDVCFGPYEVCVGRGL